MSDIIDRANDQAQRHLDAALTNRRPTVRLAPIGVCRNPLCTLELENPKALYCDDTCAREHDREQRRG